MGQGYFSAELVSTGLLEGDVGYPRSVSGSQLD